MHKPRSAPRLYIAFAVLASLALLAAACKSGGSNEKPQAGSATLIVASSELVPGPNRLAFAILDNNTQEIIEAPVARVRILNDKSLVQETAATLKTIGTSFTHTHPDGKTETHTEARSFYVARAIFDKPGIYKIEAILTTANGTTITTQGNLQVLAKGNTPAIGEAVPKSQNPTVKDTTDLSKITSDDSPDPDLYQTTIVDAIAAHKPLVVLFATPRFCTSRLCGPETEILKQLKNKHKGEAAFIHVEIWKDLDSPQPKVLNDAVKEWNLQTEPWFFLVDTNGKLFDKFEGIVPLDELEQAFEKMVKG